MPSEFWVPQGDPSWCGGVERALMSTTADMAVAFHYANGKGTVVEIDVGRIQTGGDVSFLSMVRAILRHSPPAALCLPFLSYLHEIPSYTQQTGTIYWWGGDASGEWGGLGGGRVGGGEGLQYMGERAGQGGVPARELVVALGL